MNTLYALYFVFNSAHEYFPPQDLVCFALPYHVEITLQIVTVLLEYLCGTN